MKVKGEIENAIEALNFHTYYVYRPGFLLNRDNEVRTMEKIFAKVPFISKIESRDVGKAMLEKAICYGNDIKTEDKSHKFLL